MNPVRILKSKLDKSVNWITPFKKGSIETRYVRKKDDYIIGYVSSSIGCNQGCKQCFLTQQKQTEMYHVTPNMFADQIKLVIDHYKNNDDDGLANRININFMARGDAFVNKHIVNTYPEVYDAISKPCKEANLNPKMNISTIMPYTVKYRTLQSIFKDRPAHLYYSLYSINDEYRRKWMPGSIDWKLALDKIKDYQDNGGEIVTFHWAFIEGENDKLEDVLKMAEILKEYKFNAKFNLVRYNNHNNLPYKETSIEKMNELFKIVNESLVQYKIYYDFPKIHLQF